MTTKYVNEILSLFDGLPHKPSIIRLPESVQFTSMGRTMPISKGSIVSCIAENNTLKLFHLNYSATVKFDNNEDMTRYIVENEESEKTINMDQLSMYLEYIDSVAFGVTKDKNGLTTAMKRFKDDGISFNNTKVRDYIVNLFTDGDKYSKEDVLTDYDELVKQR